MNHQDPQIRFCLLGPDLCKDSLCGPVPIILAFQETIVIHATEADKPLPGDVTTLTGCDLNGVSLIEIPVKYVSRWLTGEEAEVEMEQSYQLRTERESREAMALHFPE